LIKLKKQRKAESRKGVEHVEVGEREEGSEMESIEQPDCSFEIDENGKVFERGDL